MSQQKQYFTQKKLPAYYLSEEKKTYTPCGQPNFVLTFQPYTNE
jgi:hypothetical protein